MQTLIEKYEFPQSFPYHKNDELMLKEVNPKGYAFYETKDKFGFKQGLEIYAVYRNKEDMQNNVKQLIAVNSLSGNSWGKGSWLITRTEYYFTMKDALAALNGETRIYKPKRKPEPIRELTEQQIREYWELPKPKEED